MISGWPRPLRFFIFSNLHIALAAAVYFCGGFWLAGYLPDLFSIAFVSAATLATYNIHRLIGLSRQTDEEQAERFHFARKYRNILVGLSLLAIIVMMFIMIVDWSYRWIYFLPIALITIFYISPIFPGKRRLRDLPFVKIFALSSVWAYLFLIPIFWLPQIELSWLILLLIFLEKLLFIFALTLPFDGRDIFFDRRDNVSTLATSLDLMKLIQLIHWSILAAFILTLGLVWFGIYSPVLCLLLGLIYWAQIFLSNQLSQSPGELYYLGILDSLIIFHGMVYLTS